MRGGSAPMGLPTGGTPRRSGIAAARIDGGVSSQRGRLEAPVGPLPIGTPLRPGMVAARRENCACAPIGAGRRFGPAGLARGSANLKMVLAHGAFTPVGLSPVGTSRCSGPTATWIKSGIFPSSTGPTHGPQDRHCCKTCAASFNFR